ncbi:unnamed protein product [Closterium sp. NIES-54]
MHSRPLVSGLPRSLPPIPRSLAPPCLPSVEGRQRAAPHSSSFPPTTASLQTLHVDDLPVLRLHSDQGGEFSSRLLKDFCGVEGITQSFTVPASPQQNRIAESRIGLVMEVWGSLSLVRDLPAGKLSPCTLWCVFLGFPTDAPPWQFYLQGSHRVLSSRDVTFDESGPAPSGVSQVDLPPSIASLEVSSDTSGPAEGGDLAADASAATLRSPCLETPHRLLPRPSSPPLQPDAVEPASGSGRQRQPSRQENLSPQQFRVWAVQWGSPGGGDGSARARGTARGTRVGGAGGTGTGGPDTGGTTRGTRVGGAGGTGAGGTRGAGAGGAVTGGDTGGTGVGGASPGGGAGGAGTGGAVTTGAGGACAGGSCPRAGGFGGATTQQQPFALCHLLSLPPAVTKIPVAGTTPPLLFPSPDQSQPLLLPHSPLPAPAPYTAMSESLTGSREPASRLVTPLRTRRVARPRPPPVPGTHIMALRPSSVPQRVVLLSPPASSLPHVPDPESDLVRDVSPTVTCLLATAVTDPVFLSPAASAFVAELVDFATLCRLDYAASLVFYSARPPSVRGELALSCDVLEDSKFDLECLAVAAPHLGSMLLSPEGDANALDIPTPCSYADAITVPPPGANIVDGMWIFRVKRPPGSLPAFKARYVALGFIQRQGVDFFQTFSPTPKMTTLWVLLHIAAQRDYELHTLVFSTACLQGLHEAIWPRRPSGFTGSFPEGNQWSLRQPVHGQRPAPLEWHDTLRTTVAALGFAPSTADPSLFLHTDTSLPPFYVLVYVDDFQFSSPQLHLWTSP